mgnify:CR=1 FL=1
MKLTSTSLSSVSGSLLELVKFGASKTKGAFRKGTPLLFWPQIDHTIFPLSIITHQTMERYISVCLFHPSIRSRARTGYSPAVRLPALPRLKRDSEKPQAAPGCLRLLRILERKHLQPFDFFRTFSRTNQRFDAAFRTFFARKPEFSTLFCQKPALYLTVFSLANRLFFPAVQGFCPVL